MHAYVLGAEKRCTSGLVRKTPETDLRAQAIELDVSDAKHGSLHARSIAVARNGLSWIKAGHKHGRYTLIHRLYHGAWMARCECGAESVLNPSNPVDRHDKSERIVSAAYIFDNWGEEVIISMPAPNRHHNLISMMVAMGCETPIDNVNGYFSGFLTSSGKFVDREDGEKVARACGQLTKPLIGSILTSEDLW